MATRQFKDLSEADLAVFAQKVSASRLPRTVQKRLLAIVEASVKTQDGEGEDLTTLKVERLMTIGQGMARTISLGKSVIERGTAEIEDIPDSEWNALVREAGQDGNAD